MEKMMNNETRNAEMVTISRAEYENLLKENKNLSQKVDWFTEQLLILKRKHFGSSSEKSVEETVEALEQLSLFFNEAEVTRAAEEATTTVAEHTRKKKTSLIQEKLPENIPVEVVEHGLPESDRICSLCGDTLVPIGKEVRRTLVFVPAQAKIREDVYFTYACETCKKENTETPILKTPKAAAVISGSFASPEAIAHIMTQKFVMGAPLFRQEQEWNRAGIHLSRQTMSNWILRAAEDWLAPIYDELHRRLVSRQVLHADETTLQVLHEQGKKAQSKSYMWMYRTSGDAEHPIVLYEYKPNRKASNAEAFLEGFTGYLHADGYHGYHKLNPGIRVVGCMAHARRKFDEALTALPEKDRSGSTAEQGLAFCNKLFAIEKELADLTPEERYNQRQMRAKPVLDAFLAWAESKNAAPKSALGKALYYLKEQRSYLVRYLEDGRLELSNNRAERSIKPFVIGRKNFLFANTAAGAQGSATIYSLIETAKENGLDPFRYLTYIFSEAPSLQETVPDWVNRFTPDAVPDACRTGQ